MKYYITSGNIWDAYRHAKFLNNFKFSLDIPPNGQYNNTIKWRSKMKYNLESIKKYTKIGIRGLTRDEKYQVGDICRNSYDWDYENDCSTFATENPIELNGTCAVDSCIDIDFDTDEEIVTKLDKVLKNFNYCGCKVIIGGLNSEYGADENEIIIQDAVVLQSL